MLFSPALLRRIEITNGFDFSLHGQPRTPKGIVLEGRGVVPDIKVKLTRESLVAGGDSQLEAAIDYIRTH